MRVELHHSPQHSVIFSVDGMFFCYVYFKLVFVYGMGVGLHVQKPESLLPNEKRLQSECLKLFFRGRKPLAVDQHESLVDFVNTL